jgi:2-polyprenyl-3-methyl-5-hydroxy-6-metoxy-1,4-benzoquinol methylase
MTDESRRPQDREPAVPGNLEQAYNVYSSAGLGAYSATAQSGSYRDQYELNYGHLLPIDRESRFLDIGCGAGNYLLWLRSKGYARLRGLDLSEVAVAHCRSAGLDGVERVADLVEYLLAHRGEFDVITMNDVIEHFTHEEMLPTLGAMLAALRPGGMLLVKTLNMGNLGGIYLRYNDFTHRLGFTEVSLRQVLVAAGFPQVSVVPYRVPTRSAVGAVWKALGGLWRRAFGALLLLDVGIDRPRILTKTLLGIARADVETVRP